MDEVDEERDAHLLGIGRAITEWAEIQDELFHIVHRILECRSEHAAIVFFRTPTFEGRLSLAEELLKTVFPQTADKPGSHDHPGFVVWMDIAKAIRAEIPIRNRLAHQPVRLHLGDDRKDELAGAFHATTTSYPEHLKKKGMDEPLTTKDIRAHIGRISDFATRLLAFRSGPLQRRLQGVE
jgi:hypothetical protein